MLPRHAAGRRRPRPGGDTGTVAPTRMLRIIESDDIMMIIIMMMLGPWHSGYASEPSVAGLT